MHPETPHIVLTTRTCVALGCHFYTLATTRETFFAMVAEHFNGRFITNMEHPQAPLLYLKAVDAIFTGFIRIYGYDCKKLPPKWHSSYFPLLPRSLAHTVFRLLADGRRAHLDYSIGPLLARTMPRDLDRWNRVALANFRRFQRRPRLRMRSCRGSLVLAVCPRF